MTHIERYGDGTGWLYHGGHKFPLRAGQDEPDEVAHCQYCHVSYAGTGPTYSAPCLGLAPLSPCVGCADFAETRRCPPGCPVQARADRAEARAADLEAALRFLQREREET